MALYSSTDTSASDQTDADRVGIEAALRVIRSHWHLFQEFSPFTVRQPLTQHLSNMQLIPTKTGEECLLNQAQEAAGLLPLWHLQIEPEEEEDHPETLGPRNYSSTPIIPARSSFTVAVSKLRAKPLFLLSFATQENICAFPSLVK